MADYFLGLFFSFCCIYLITHDYHPCILQVCGDKCDFRKMLFGELGRGQTGCFFKEASKIGTSLDQAVSCLDPWEA